MRKLARALRVPLAMFPEAPHPNRSRRPRRYALDAVGHDSVLLLMLLALFLLMAAVALAVIGTAPVPAI